ncbi:MAG: hypothetical protein D6B25_05500 [Desulfobulbaceae bacterium]|nr:MAG: hypothetical protein D6B25_05500 [Desulfobulbaceae bacterium]
MHGPFFYVIPRKSLWFFAIEQNFFEPFQALFFTIFYPPPRKFLNLLGRLCSDQYLGSILLAGYLHPE